MKKIIKKYRATLFLTAMFIFSLHINAVFEGRSEQLKEYTEIRQQVELQEYSTPKATGIGFGDPTESEGTGFEAPLNDSSLFIFLICPLISGIYYWKKERKRK